MAKNPLTNMFKIFGMVSEAEKELQRKWIEAYGPLLQLSTFPFHNSEELRKEIEKRRNHVIALLEKQGTSSPDSDENASPPDSFRDVATAITGLTAVIELACQRSEVVAMKANGISKKANKIAVRSLAEAEKANGLSAEANRTAHWANCWTMAALAVSVLSMLIAGGALWVSFLR